MLTSSRRYTKCSFCNFFTHKRFNKCEIFKFKHEEKVLCAYNTIWSIYKWFVRIGVAPIVLFCIYRVIKELVQYCKEVEVWRILSLFLAGVILIAGVVILVLIIATICYGVHEQFTGCQHGSIWGGEQ